MRCKKSATLLLLFFVPLIIGASEDQCHDGLEERVPVQVRAQAGASTCWAAVTEMVGDFLEMGICQCKLVSRIASRDCCSREAKTRINECWYPEAKLRFPESGIIAQECKTPLLWRQIKDLIKARQPIVYGYGKASSIGHAVLVKGFCECADESRWFLIVNDPGIFGSAGERYIPFNQYSNDPTLKHKISYFNFRNAALGRNQALPDIVCQDTKEADGNIAIDHYEEIFTTISPSLIQSIKVNVKSAISSLALPVSCSIGEGTGTYKFNKMEEGDDVASEKRIAFETNHTLVIRTVDDVALESLLNNGHSEGGSISYSVQALTPAAEHDADGHPAFWVQYNIQQEGPVFSGIIDYNFGKFVYYELRRLDIQPELLFSDNCEIFYIKKYNQLIIKFGAGTTDDAIIPNLEEANLNRRLMVVADAPQGAAGTRRILREIN